MKTRERNAAMVLNAIAEGAEPDLVAAMSVEFQVIGDVLEKAVTYFYLSLCKPGRANVYTAEQAVEACNTAFEIEDADDILFKGCN